jgi:WD40 repeat protein
MEGGSVEKLSIRTGQQIGGVLKSPLREDALSVSVSGVAVGQTYDSPPTLFAAANPAGSRVLQFPASKVQRVGLDGTQPIALHFDQGFLLGTPHRSLDFGNVSVPVLTSAAGVTVALLATDDEFRAQLVQGGKLVSGPALTEFNDDLQFFQISSNGNYLLAHNGSTLAITDLARKTSSLHRTDDLDLGEDLFDLAAVSADGSEIALVTTDGTALRVNSRTNEIISTVQLPKGVEAGLLDIAPDGTMALAVRRDDQAEMWLFKKNAITPVEQLKYTGWIDDLNFSPDGKALALNVSGPYSGVIVLDSNSGAELARSVPLSLYAGGMAWNATGTQVLVGRGVNSTVGSVTLLNFKR